MSAEVRFEWLMEQAAEGADEDPTNPLTRALRNLLADGQPFRKLAPCFLRTPRVPGAPPTSRWLGVFVYSAGDRILFFPGYSRPPEEAQTFEGPSARWRGPFVADHLSVEKHRRHWHLTAPSSAKHLGGPPTLDLGSSRHLWFGMSVGDLGWLREARRATAVQAAVPEGDAARRLGVFRQAPDAGPYPVVHPPAPALLGRGPGFLHLSVILGPEGFPEYRGDRARLPPRVPVPLDAAPRGARGPPGRVLPRGAPAARGATGHGHVAPGPPHRARHLHRPGQAADFLRGTCRGRVGRANFFRARSSPSGSPERPSRPGCSGGASRGSRGPCDAARRGGPRPPGSQRS